VRPEPSETAARIYRRIESAQEQHIERIKEIIRIPSIAAEYPEQVRRCAELLHGWFRDLGCADTGIFDTAGSPVVYGHYDAKAKNTVLVYMMYDVKQVSGELWTLVKDPFDPQLVQMPPFTKVLVGRGAVNSKGPLVAFLSALFSIRETGEELPVNLKFVAEGEEELGSQHLVDFVLEHKKELAGGSACFAPSTSQNINGVPTLHLGCKGVVEVELECSGEYWGRGPTKRGIHSSLNAIVESPIWRMTQALASMVDPRDPSRVVIDGFYDNVAKPTAQDLKLVEELAKVFDEDAVKKVNDVKHFWQDLQGKKLLMKAFYTTTLNIQGIEGGYTGPKFKTVLPHSIKVKLESRLIPNQTRSETLRNIRRHLDKKGYPDIRVVDTSSGLSDDWSRTRPEAGVVKLVESAYRDWGFSLQVWPFSLGTSPQYVFTKRLKIPYVAAGLGHGGRAHAPDEYFVVEGDPENKVAGLVDQEKFYVHLLYMMRSQKLD
jgi:acetylornithine deacetylase/succinyl-diaminopimelate desuccinylase-like protein